IRTYRFWALAVMTLLFSFGYFLIAPQLFVLTQELEAFQVRSVAVAFIIGDPGFNKGAAKFLGGMISDYLGREKTITISTDVIVLGIFLLNLVQGSPSAWLLFIAIFTYGIGYGFSLATMMAAYTDVFQGPRLGAILGYLTLMGLLGAGFGTSVGGYLRDVTGGFQTNFLLATLAFISSV